MHAMSNVNAHEILQEIINRLPKNIHKACSDCDEIWPWTVFYYESRLYDISLVYIDEWEIHITQGHVNGIAIKLADPELIYKIIEYINLRRYGS